ncbi:hypothetical protein Tco_0454969 [Tanacetum coccineum]
MECLYKEDDDKIFTSGEPFEEMGSKAIEVPALKDEEFAQITDLGEHVSFPNGPITAFSLSDAALSSRALSTSAAFPELLLPSYCCVDVLSYVLA